MLMLMPRFADADMLIHTLSYHATYAMIYARRR